MFPHSYKNYKIPSNTVYSTVFLHAIQQLQVILHTELILLQEILQLQGSSRAGSFQQLFPMSPSILHGRIRLPAPLQHSKAIQHKQASSNSARQKQHSTRQPASTQSLQQLPGQFYSSTLQNSTRRNRIHSKGLSIVCPYNTKVSVFQFTYSCFRIILQEN